MFSEAMEWEARGDGLRRAGRFEDAIEAYRTALRHCFQWNWDARSCEKIREKIWAVQIEEFEAFAAAPKAFEHSVHPDTVELVAAKLWIGGFVAQAEATVSTASRGGMLVSGEFLDRLADRWESSRRDSAGAAWLRAQARQLRREELSKPAFAKA